MEMLYNSIIWRNHTIDTTAIGSSESFSLIMFPFFLHLWQRWCWRQDSVPMPSKSLFGNLKKRKEFIVIFFVCLNLKLLLKAKTLVLGFFLEISVVYWTLVIPVGNIILTSILLQEPKKEELKKIKSFCLLNSGAAGKDKAKTKETKEQ